MRRENIYTDILLLSEGLDGSVVDAHERVEGLFFGHGRRNCELACWQLSQMFMKSLTLEGMLSSNIE